MLNKTFVDLEYIIVQQMARLLVGQYQQTAPYGSKQVSPFFSAFVIPEELRATWSNLFPFGCGHVILEITKSFRMNRFKGSKSEFNLDLFDFFIFTKLLSYLIGVPFIKILRFWKLEFSGWPKNFRNSRNEIWRLTKNIDIFGN